MKAATHSPHCRDETRIQVATSRGHSPDGRGPVDHVLLGNGIRDAIVDPHGPVITRVLSTADSPGPDHGHLGGHGYRVRSESAAHLPSRRHKAVVHRPA